MWSDNESDVDLLRFRYIATTIATVIKSPQLLPTTIGVYSDWGGGKSTLLKMLQAEFAGDDRLLCLTFQGWLFESYEDAKSALMGTILDAIAERTVDRASFTQKGKDLLGKMRSRVNWLLALRLGGGYVLPTVLGLPHITAANAAIDSRKALTSLSAALRDKTADPEQAQELLRAAPGGPEEVRRNIRDFRADFAMLLQEAHIDTLVVFIDDLDRCLPDTIIETLEAIKLFLFVSGTAFVVAADERLVKYAVRQRFPELPGTETEVGRKYLEKLIQVPVKIPPLGTADIWSYMNLLFAQRHLDDTGFAKVYDAVSAFKSDNVTDLSFDLARARDLLGADMPPELESDLDFINQIAPVIIPGLAGNPRRTKRFLNSLILRLQLGEARGLVMQRRVLAKLMMLEYIKPVFFRQLAQIQADSAGKPPALTALEQQLGRAAQGVASEQDHAVAAIPPSEESTRASNKATKHEQSVQSQASDSTPSELKPWLADGWMQAWLASDPALGGIDLRSYYYIAHDDVGVLASASSKLSPAATDVLNKLLDQGQVTRKVGLRAVQQLNEADATAVFDHLAQRVRQAELLDDASPQKVMFELVNLRKELLPQLVSLYQSLPDPKLTAAIPILLWQAAKGSPSASAAQDTINRWTTSSNAILAQAAKAVYKRATQAKGG